MAPTQSLETFPYFPPTPPHNPPFPPIAPHPPIATPPPPHSPTPPTPAAKPPSHLVPPPSPFVKPPPHPIPPPPPHAVPPPPPHIVPSPPPPHVVPPPPPPHVLPPPPPHIVPPPAPTPGHHTVIIVVFVSLGGLFFLAFLSVALCCFIKKRKKRMIQETDIVKVDEHMRIQEEIVPGPHGTQALILSIDEDVHVEEEIKKSELVGEGSHVRSAKDHHHGALDMGASTFESSDHHANKI